MKLAELKTLLKAGEWNDAEFKEARTEVPKSVYETAGTGLRMMREAWRGLGHPAPTYKNDRAWKAFEFFIPGLDKEVDMASDLVKAMFGEAPQGKAAVGGQDTGEVRRLLAVCTGTMKRTELQQALGLRHEDNFRDVYLTPALAAGLIAMTIPDKPRSSKQKYRLTPAGVKALKREGGDDGE